MPDGTVEDLLQPANRQRLTAILKHHLLPRRLLLTSQSLTTLQEDTLQVRAAGPVRVEEARVLLADIKATNGVIHVIDQVLLPDLPEPTPARQAMSVIELAIERGVPLFNSHRVEACAAIYEVTAQSLLTGHADSLDDSARKRLREALAKVRKDHSPRKKAWVLHTLWMTFTNRCEKAAVARPAADDSFPPSQSQTKRPLRWAGHHADRQRRRVQEPAYV